MLMTIRNSTAGLGAAMPGLGAEPPALALASPHPLIRWAELDVDLARLDDFKAAARALAEAVLRTEPGVAAYHAVSEGDNPTRVHVLEMYDDAEVYQAHVQQAHFRDFRATTDKMVTSRRLYDAVPVGLGAKARLTASPQSRIAEIVIDPFELPAYEAAVSEEIDDSIRLEAGVLALYALALVDKPGHLRFLEIYADEAAYRQHLASPHFTKYAKAAEPKIRSRRLLAVCPVFLGLRQRRRPATGPRA